MQDQVGDGATGAPTTATSHGGRSSSGAVSGPPPTPAPFTSFTALILGLSPSPVVPDSSSTIASRRIDLSASPLTDPEAAAFASPRGGGRVTSGFMICFPNYSSL